jgi:hypothetical protein
VTATLGDIARLQRVDLGYRPDSTFVARHAAAEPISNRQ